MRNWVELVLAIFSAAGVVYAIVDSQWLLLILTAVTLTLAIAWILLQRSIEMSPTMWDLSLKLRAGRPNRHRQGSGDEDYPRLAVLVAKALWGDVDENSELAHRSIRFLEREKTLEARRALQGMALDEENTNSSDDVGADVAARPVGAPYPRESTQGEEGHSLVAPLKALTNRRNWPGWAFAIGLTRAGIKVEGAPKSGGVGTVSISLGDTPVGIYNNAGKRFLDEQWPLTEAATRHEDREAYVKALELSMLAQAAFLDPDTGVPTPLAEGTPLRWASAGVLPIANWRGREWVVLFFRDIRPKGWNLANGASETEDERFDLTRLAHREFCEELLIVNHDPLETSKDLIVKPFSFDGAYGERSLLESRKFALEHASLRSSEDNLTLQWPQSPSDTIDVTTVRTRWRAVVSGGGTTGKETRNVIPTLNPLERGIEMTQIIRFDLADDDHILDGEILEDVGGNRILARRPVGLISLDFIRQSFTDNTWSEATRDRRLLPTIREEDLHVFSIENRLRQGRLADLARQRPASVLPTEEERHHQQWYEEFAGVYGHDAGQLEQVRLLCPVVWKTLHIALETGSL